MFEKERDEKEHAEQDPKEEQQKENEDNTQNTQDVDEKNNEVEKEKESKTEKVEVKEPENVKENGKNKKEKEKEKKKQKQREKEEKKKREKEEKERKKAEEKERKKAKRGKKGKLEAEEKANPKTAEENKEEDKSKEDNKEEEEEKKEEPTVENQVKEVKNEDDEIIKVEELQKENELQKAEENTDVKEIDNTQQGRGEETNPKEKEDVNETKENLKESVDAENASDFEKGKEEMKNEASDESEEETNPKVEHGEPRSMQDRVASITAMCLNLLPVPGLEPTESPWKREEKEESPELLANRMERDKQILSHCRDDIQRFICKLEKCAEAFQELSKRKGPSSASEPASGVGVLTLRARPPKEEEFVDSLQKIKYSFNLLSKLHDHPLDPSVDDQLHSLFQSLDKVVQDCGVEMANEVITPLLSTDTISLLSTVPSPLEQAIWNTLGDAWHMARSSWPRSQYVPVYVPQFNNGWEPPHLNFMGKEEAPGTAHIAESLVSAAAQRHKYEELGLQSKNYVQQFPPADGDKPAPYKHSPISDQGEAAVAFKQIVSQHLERNYEAHGKSVPKKIARCRYDFVARSSNEISVMTGEMVEVLDISRPWWKVRGPCGDVGFVPSNIVVLQDGSERRQSFWQEDNIPLSSPPPGSSSPRKLNENSNQEFMDQPWKPTEHVGDWNGYGDESPEPPISPAPGEGNKPKPVLPPEWRDKKAQLDEMQQELAERLQLRNKPAQDKTKL
uniref:SH3 domain-containing protein n=1 Tax=Eptatretus burgeri TaxID=7764 RepID=A0A8C4N584_EPTBU